MRNRPAAGGLTSGAAARRGDGRDGSDGGEQHDGARGGRRRGASSTTARGVAGDGARAARTTARGVGQGAGDVRGAAPEQLHGKHDGVGSLGRDGKQHDGVGASERSGACRLNRSEYLGKKGQRPRFIYEKDFSTGS